MMTSTTNNSMSVKPCAVRRAAADAAMRGSKRVGVIDP
jgi:hypothetical protein